jgi:hypothetical protein
MSDNKMQLKEQLTTVAIDLMMNHKTSQREMHEWIREALKVHVHGLPPIRVLYNNCYGGYGYSKQFKAFLEEHNGRSTTQKEERIDAVKYISMFATQLLDSGLYKGLREILYIYHYHGFDSIISKVSKVINMEKEKLSVLFNVEIIRSYLNSPNSKYNEVKDEVSPMKLPIWVLKLTPIDTKLANYTKQELEVLLNDYYEGTYMTELDETLSSTIHHLTTQLGQDIYNELDSFVENEQLKASDACKNKWLDFDKNKYKVFTSLLAKNGFTDDIVWHYQRFYEKYAIKYLFKCYLDNSDMMSAASSSPDTVYDFVFNTQVPLKKDVMDVVEETFGLLCASGSCSKLAITTVPAILEWEVGEYDGLENVYVV